MEDWRMMIANDPNRPPWWVWFLLAGILIGSVLLGLQRYELFLFN